jgi:hypothetical protein
MFVHSSRKLARLAVAATALSLIGTGPAHSNEPHKFFSGVGTVKVFCGHNTIAGALKRYPLRALVIVVKGTCAEDVLIERSRVTLMADTARVDGLVGQIDGDAAVTVAGAQNVVIDGLNIRPASGSSAGIFVTGNAEATVRNALIDQGGDGIRANHGAFVRLEESEIRNAGAYGLLLSDAANARIEDSIVEVGDSGGGGSAAIGAFRSINIRLRGDNQIRNKGSGFSLDLFHSVELRQDGGHTVFTGPMEFGNLSHGSLRNPEIVGGIDLFGGSRLDIRPSSNGAKEVTGANRLGIFGNSQLELRSGTSAEVADIEVHERSALDLGSNVHVQAEQANMNASMMSIGDFSSLTIDQNMFIGGTGLRLGHRASVAIGGEFGVFSKAEVGVFGPNANLHVAGTMAVSAFSQVHIGTESTLGVDLGLNIHDFSLMFAESMARIDADLDFGGSIAKVNLFGDGVTYTGTMQLSPTSSLDFGSNASVEGSINCNGGDFSAGPGFSISGGTIMGCLSWP